MVVIFHLIQSWPGCSNNFVACATRQLYMRGFLNGRPLDGENKHSILTKNTLEQVYVFDSICYIHATREMSLNSRILKHVELIFIGLSNVHSLPEFRNWDVSLFLFLSFVFFIKLPKHRFVLRLFIHAFLKHVKISCLSIIEKWPCLNRTCKCQNHGISMFDSVISLTSHGVLLHHLRDVTEINSNWSISGKRTFCLPST